MYVMGDAKLPAAFLVLVSTLALLTSLSGLSFPYSAANQCPKRVFFQVSMIMAKTCPFLTSWFGCQELSSCSGPNKSDSFEVLSNGSWTSKFEGVSGKCQLKSRDHMETKRHTKG